MVSPSELDDKPVIQCLPNSLVRSRDWLATFTAQLRLSPQVGDSPFLSLGFLLDPQPALSALRTGSDYLFFPPPHCPPWIHYQCWNWGSWLPPTAFRCHLEFTSNARWAPQAWEKWLGKTLFRPRRLWGGVEKRIFTAKMGISNARKKGPECYLLFLTVPYGRPSHVLLVPGPPLIAFPSSGGKFPQQWARPSPGPTCALA